MSYQNSYMLLVCGTLLSYLLIMFGVYRETGLFIGIGLLGVVISIVQAEIYCRCPHCKESLLKIRGITHYCPSCGTRV